MFSLHSTIVSAKLPSPHFVLLHMLKTFLLAYDNALLLWNTESPRLPFLALPHHPVTRFLQTICPPGFVRVFEACCPLLSLPGVTIVPAPTASPPLPATAVHSIYAPDELSFGLLLLSVKAAGSAIVDALHKREPVLSAAVAGAVVN